MYKWEKKNIAAECVYLYCKQLRQFAYLLINLMMDQVPMSPQDKEIYNLIRFVVYHSVIWYVFLII